jgi:hypothetical protein
MEKWTAFSDMGGWASFYNHDYCTRSSFVSHEGTYLHPKHSPETHRPASSISSYTVFFSVGHNLNLKHSGVPFGPYQDRSCLMGKSYLTIGGPSMCFNGNKMWLLGWYADRRIEVDPANGPWSGTIAAFVDYKKSKNPMEYILIKVGDFYLVYNRKKDFNSEVDLRGDQVTIVQYDVNHEADRERSVLLKGLDATTTTYTHATYGGVEITFDVCAVTKRGAVDVMDISIHLTTQNSTCSVDDGRGDSSLLQISSLLLPVTISKFTVLVMACVLLLRLSGCRFLLRALRYVGTTS